MNCPKCGNLIPDSATFCTGCGEQISNEDSASSYSATPAYTPPPPPAPAPQASTYAPPPPAQAAQPPSPPTPAPKEDDSNVLSVLAAIGMMILSAIPLVGFISIIIMACVAKNRSIKNLSIAMIIVQVIAVVFVIIASFSIAALLANLAYSQDGQRFFESLAPYVQ